MCIRDRFYEIRDSENFGRYLVAKEDIPARTLILNECALIYAPADECNSDKDESTSSSMLFCLGCCIHLKRDSKETCSKCGWPLCSKSYRSVILLFNTLTIKLLNRLFNSFQN